MRFLIRSICTKCMFVFYVWRMQPLRHSISFLFRIRYFPTLRLISSNAPKSLPHANPHHKQSSLFILFFSLSFSLCSRYVWFRHYERKKHFIDSNNFIINSHSFISHLWVEFVSVCIFPFFIYSFVFVNALIELFSFANDNVFFPYCLWFFFCYLLPLLSYCNNGDILAFDLFKHKMENVLNKRRKKNAILILRGVLLSVYFFANRFSLQYLHSFQFNAFIYKNIYLHFTNKWLWFMTHSMAIQKIERIEWEILWMLPSL